MVKSILFSIVFFCALVYSSCTSPKHGGPVEEPAHILSSFMNFWYYWNDNVKLSEGYIAYDENDSLISKAGFLKKLSSGEYLPLRLKSNDTLYYYKLYRLNDQTSEDIPRTIEQYGKLYYKYFQMEGKPLPGFNFVDLNGNLYNEESCKGKIVVLNCWFIGCHACVEEMPALNQLINVYKSRKDILFVSLAWDSQNKLKAFLTKTKFDFEVIPNKNHYLLDTLKVIEFPTDLIINKKGLIVNIMNDYDELEIALRKESLK